jgi:hypothetical protein
MAFVRTTWCGSRVRHPSLPELTLGRSFWPANHLLFGRANHLPSTDTRDRALAARFRKKEVFCTAPIAVRDDVMFSFFGEAGKRNQLASTFCFPVHKPLTTAPTPCTNPKPLRPPFNISDSYTKGRVEAVYSLDKCPAPGWLDNDNGILKCLGLGNAPDIVKGGYVVASLPFGEPSLIFILFGAWERPRLLAPFAIHLARKDLRTAALGMSRPIAEAGCLARSLRRDVSPDR